MSIFKNNFVILLFIVFIAGILRFYQLGINPPSLDWDEASLGYNAYSILKTGADEYGNKFPIAIRSFDDYKPALYTYLTIPSVYFFGLSEFSVRFPSALFGTLTVLLTYFLVLELFNSKSTALLSSFFLAISPWHLQFSRAAFEANIGLFFFILSVYLFIKGIRDGKLLILSFLAGVLGFYSYHSVRLVLPVLLLGLTFFVLKTPNFRKEILKQKNLFILGLILAFFLTLPILIQLKGSSSRLASVTIFNPNGTLDKSIQELEFDKGRNDILGEIFHNRRIVYSLAVIKGYLDHYNPNFLFITGDGIDRHHPVNFGLMYLFELPFLILGILYLFGQKGKGRFVIFLWFLVAPLASSITTGTPHPVRALLFLPTYQIFTALGVIWCFDRLRKLRIKNFLIIGYLIFAVFNFSYYLHQYYIHTPIETSEAWQYGFKQVFKEASKIDNNYKKVIVTYGYDQPYIFYLFYRKIDPSWYQKNWDFLGTGKIERMHRIIGKYEFKNINFEKDAGKNVLLIGTPNEISKEKAFKEIKFLNGSVAFRFAKS